ncbi:prepilin-type N-terminal cleavage/methylation domain-containing protein [Patescibacteria group bacterium]|nr:prepilin-type N-terminal cleavage/methylation domain-containing protein [Patescibacteria group bacterium]MCG2695262.1 prepilin-type N-terminal cleavage/methylation domain-containing protein [Candidatus Parcubacteria bacterium]
MKNKLNKKTNGGLTLIEVVVSVSIFSIIVVVLFSSIIYFYKVNRYSLDQAFAIESARRGVEFMVRDIREAVYSDEGSYPIISASENSFYFYSDIDRDNNVERVRYFLDGSDFKKGLTEPLGSPLSYHDTDEVISVVSDNIMNSEESSDVFQYFNQDGVEITDLSSIVDISFIKVNLIVNVDVNRQPGNFVLLSGVTLRNLKTNL